jgi:hypothetical protein
MRSGEFSFNVVVSSSDGAFLFHNRSECDASRSGSLDRDGFVIGMWRIDEELRRARTQAVKSASASSLGSLRGRSCYKLPSQKSKPILR